MDETLRSTVGRDAEVPRKRRVSDMRAKYIVTLRGSGNAVCLLSLYKTARRERGQMATRTARKSKSTASIRAAEQQRIKSHPEPPLPKQHQEYPGIESKVRPRPQFQAPLYKGADKLKGEV